MADLTEFAEPTFKPKAWINQACIPRPLDEPLEKFLAELEMRLQLTAEEIEASLQDHSNQAMRRMPVAVQEIHRLQDLFLEQRRGVVVGGQVACTSITPMADVPTCTTGESRWGAGDIQGMQDQVKVLSQQVGRDARDASSSVEVLGQLDLVRRNMESACSTLKEATELSGLFIKVEEVFAAGELPKVAELLSSMRRSLSLVGDVPEFRAGRQKLKVLEDRLQSMIEGSLAEALNKGDDDDSVKQLCALLLAVDRHSTIQQMYCASRLARVHALWGEASKAPGESVLVWLPQFFSTLLTFLEEEMHWCNKVLPQQAAQLLYALVAASFEKVSKGASERLATIKSITGLTALVRDTTIFAQGLCGVLEPVALEQKEEVLHLVLQPLQDKVAKYGELEQQQLQADVNAALQPIASAAPSSEDAEPLAGQLSTSSKQIFSSLHAALERCLSFTGGSELQPFIRILDSQLASAITKLQTTVSVLHSQTSSLAFAEDSEDLANIIRLVKVSDELSSSLTILEAAIRTAITSSVPKLGLLAEKKASDPASCLGDPVTMRVAHHPDKLQKLQALLASLQDPRFLALSNSTAAADLFAKTVHNTVLGVLLARVKMQLKVLPDLADWSKQGEEDLPTFSAYPLQYVQTIGEYLMTLPQQLEVLITEEDGDDSDELAAEWLDKVVCGAGALYAEQVVRIPALSQLGGMQLAADVEYFCNVMSALQAAPPNSLLTIQLFAGHPDDQFTSAAQHAVAEGGADVGVLKQLATMRSIQMQL